MDPLGHVTITAYDQDNRATLVIDGLGRKRQLAYDGDGRLTQETWYAANGSVTDTRTFGYDEAGNLLAASNSAGTYSYTYDADGRKLTQTDPNGITLKLNFGCDANGNTTSVADSLGGTLTSQYDAGGRLGSRRLSAGATQMRVDFGYDANANLLSQTRYADLAGTQKVGSTQSTFDAANRLTEIRNGGDTVCNMIS
jgi:YD repeat-containing protein